MCGTASLRKLFFCIRLRRISTWLFYPTTSSPSMTVRTASTSTKSLRLLYCNHPSFSNLDMIAEIWGTVSADKPGRSFMRERNHDLRQSLIGQNASAVVPSQPQKNSRHTLFGSQKGKGLDIVSTLVEPFVENACKIEGKCSLLLDQLVKMVRGNE